MLRRRAKVVATVILEVEIPEPHPPLALAVAAAEALARERLDGFTVARCEVEEIRDV